MLVYSVPWLFTTSIVQQFILASSYHTSEDKQGCSTFNMIYSGVSLIWGVLPRAVIRHRKVRLSPCIHTDEEAVSSRVRKGIDWGVFLCPLGDAARWKSTEVILFYARKYYSFTEEPPHFFTGSGKELGEYFAWFNMNIICPTSILLGF